MNRLVFLISQLRFEMIIQYYRLSGNISIYMDSMSIRWAFQRCRIELFIQKYIIYYLHIALILIGITIKKVSLYAKYKSFDKVNIIFTRWGQLMKYESDKANREARIAIELIAQDLADDFGCSKADMLDLMGYYDYGDM